MVDVVVYVSSVANPHKHPRKISCLENFARGVKNSGGSVHVEWKHQYQPSRLAVMLGWATTNMGGPNIALRKQIIHNQQQRGYHTMCIDASCWKYLDNAGTYLRYSLGGPFYDQAEYANRNSNNQKWLQISQELNIQLKEPVDHPSGYILIGMQRDGGFAMKTLDPIQWMIEKIRQIRQYTNRHIVVRPHPGSYNMADFEFIKPHPDVTVVDPLESTLLENIKLAHSAVFFNSSASVAAVCEGVPVFVDDISCVSWAVANKDISRIESPKIYSRDAWVNDLAAAHWSDNDGQSGLIYQKFLPYLK